MHSNSIFLAIVAHINSLGLSAEHIVGEACGNRESEAYNYEFGALAFERKLYENPEQILAWVVNTRPERARMMFSQIENFIETRTSEE